MLFHFHLTPVDKIEPWTIPSQGNKQFLSWFGLTLGEYWLDVGGVELFRYTPEMMSYWAKEFPEAKQSAHVDYQVVRLWEDVLDILPAVLDPVPDDLAVCLLPGGRWGSARAWNEWREKAQEWMEQTDDEGAWDLYFQAVSWRDSRKLDAGYLRAAPGIWFWRSGDTLQIQWDNAGILLEGIQTWEAVAGTANLPITDW